MRVLVSRNLTQRVLRWAQHGLLAVGVLLLGYCAFALLDSWTFQARQGRELDRRSQDELTPILTPAPDDRSSGAIQPPSVMPEGVVARLEIQRLGLSVVVAEGIDKRTLRRAVGHIPGTALPGRPGNIGIAGHRDTFFRPLEGVEAGDVITLTATGPQLSYRVVDLRVVSPDDVAVLEPTSHEVLTLVTCHPFYFVGPAPNRFIVRAERFTP